MFWYFCHGTPFRHWQQPRAWSLIRSAISHLYIVLLCTHISQSCSSTHPLLGFTAIHSTSSNKDIVCFHIWFSASPFSRKINFTCDNHSRHKPALLLKTFKDGTIYPLEILNISCCNIFLFKHFEFIPFCHRPEHCFFT